MSAQSKIFPTAHCLTSCGNGIFSFDSILINFVSNTLLNWVSLKNLDLNTAQDKINAKDSIFENLKDIQNVFLHCFYKSQKTEFFFEELVLNQKIDFSRYNYFYAAHLSNIGKIEQAKKICQQLAQNINFSESCYMKAGKLVE